MKRFFSLVLLAFFVLGAAGCAEREQAVTNDFVILEATETYLLVEQISEDGKKIEGMQYSLSNYFDPSVKIEAGSVITIKHSGIALETYPMQFAKVYSIQYHDAETGRTITVTPDQ